MVQQTTVSPFPWKLHDMLKDCEKQGKGHIVSWLPHGNAFKVHKVSEFVSTILPSWFKQTKYKSFQRQLNLWGYERITKNGPEKGAYFHKHFLKGQPKLCRLLTRQRGNRKSPLPETTKSNSSRQSLQVSSYKTSGPCTPDISMLKFDEATFIEPDLISEDHDDPLSNNPVSFEGCTFFPLDEERCQELAQQVSRITAQSFSQPRPKKDSAWELLQELEQGSVGFSKRAGGFRSFHQGAQLCAV